MPEIPFRGGIWRCRCIAHQKAPNPLGPRRDPSVGPEGVCLMSEVPLHAERLVIYCQTTGVSAAHATHCATYCTPCRPLIRAFSGWIQTPPPTLYAEMACAGMLCLSKPFLNFEKYLINPVPLSPVPTRTLSQATGERYPLWTSIGPYA